MSMDRDAYTAIIETDVAKALPRWQGLIESGAIASVFQTTHWLAAWYATLGAQAGRTPLLASIARRSDGRTVMALPLIREERGGLIRIAFADAGVTDYAAPLWMPDCPDDGEAVRAMFAALRRALPRADLWTIDKMPERVGDCPNPLRRLPGTRPSALFGNPATIGEDFEAWRFSREKTHRKELERSWRVFTRHADARFEQILDVERAMQVMDALEVHQRAAILGKGWAYLLDEPGYREFYRTVIRQGLPGGEVVLTALMAGEEVVAALLGLRRDSEYAMIRIGNAAGEWRSCSPGRLVIERTMAALHAQGVRRFDFTIGDYAYKRGFMPDQLGLFDSTVALSWRGLPRSAQVALKHRARRWLATHPRLRERLSAMKSRRADRAQ
ncbi:MULTISPECIES: GNAT family N-acetyltransferase [unclassified Lysobacter]|uniref:GNAT family N-acetyltransferase n=1 Tax=unclassified Lysobacter TaxID=2635362 RepID=UPI001BE9A234|nr:MULTISPECIES: GNAT family N-acetyltransferase [unclassified Lysobacter]MBT2748640.1 GNAT family N-acetyltransferase [Lysobacter sp. ISL-42]MBT2751575.1 GNAT family N-acetyltransferase [Lysobacter sp. ISL-50]MBT2775769.1 GNAT family N-acetyltransferase [Lysobacter sp. ISL-54]MBT2782266.1 GNAT family N-acetyltransferase [Lysobacter sp. ISL-52]